jgi:hypothetical protein
MARWWWWPGDFDEGRWRGGGEIVLGGSGRGGEAIWGGVEDWKLTRRSVHSDTIRVGKLDGDDAVEVQGRWVLGPRSTRATLASSRRCRVGRRRAGGGYLR